MNWPLMTDNVTVEDRKVAADFLLRSTRLTQGDEVKAFEQEFADWLGIRHAVFVNSGSSANLVTLAALRHLKGPGEIVVPALTWVSDIAAVIHAGFTPRFVDISPRTLGVDWSRVVIGPETRAVFPTHTLGFNAFTGKLPDVAVIEDCCECLGATLGDWKLGTFGLASNFSFYYAHHMSTVEGGMICTDDEEFYQVCRSLRSHGLTRETSPAFRAVFETGSTWPEFTFAYPAFNVRSTEINAVIGRNQLKRLDANNHKRIGNLKAWVHALEGSRFWVDYAMEGACSYALPLVVRDPKLMPKVVALLERDGIEYRRGTAGGGNQLRQPYLKGQADPSAFPVAEHVHNFGLYIGNFPGLKPTAIVALAERLNTL